MEHLIEPYPHQLQAIELSNKLKHMALLWDMGTGKTGTAINILRQRYTNHQRLLKTLILAPQATLYNWEDEISKWSKIPRQKVWVIRGSGKQRIKHLQSVICDSSGTPNREVIIIINWEALLNEELFSMIMAWCPRCIIGDELHLIKGYKSKRSKKAVDLADQCRKSGGYVLGLTGTAILNSIEDIYMQYRFLDGGERFGSNFFAFRNRYLVDGHAGWSNRPGYFPKWEPRIEMFSELHDKIYSIATRITKKDCLELPELVIENRYFEMPAEQKKMYKEMKEDFVAFIEEKEKQRMPRAAIANLAITKSLRLLQITSGYVTDDDGKDYYIKKNPRLELTKDLLEQITPSEKVIIWCCFKANYKMLEDLCAKMKIEYRTIFGGQDAKERHEGIKAFQEDEKVRVIIANTRAGGTGINLTAASYSIVFSRNFNLGDEKQSEARNYRKGSEIHENITKINLLAKDSIDELVLAALDSKQKLSDIIIDWSKA